MKLLNKEGQEIATIDLGIVEAGKSKDYEYVLYNDSVADVVDIQVKIPNPEVEIMTYPKELSSKLKGELKIKWSPTLTLKKGLKTVFQLNAKELYR